ncbi:MAG: DmsE family decaheme c-type cytochrome [Terriglobales bacterium]
MGPSLSHSRNLLSRAAPRVALLIGAGAILLAARGPTHAAAQEAQPTPVPQESEQAPAPTKRPVVIGRACQMCHRAVVTGFPLDAHGKSAKFPQGSLAAMCETCHGDLARHTETGKAEDVPMPTLISSGLVNQTCLTCHSRSSQHAFWGGSRHDIKAVSCLSCHSAHHALSEKRMLVKREANEVCLTCHVAVRQALFQRSTHLFRTEHQNVKVGCIDCHNPHGGESRAMLAGLSVTETCLSCHSEKRGPMLWEHAPVRESCLTCHQPHGSNNLSLLKARTAMLCQQCHMHMLWRHETIPGFDAFSYNRGCLNCHNQVHGSNHPSGKAFTR